jgi:RNA-directed DNA polymerase
VKAKLQEIKATLRRRMHQPLPELGKWLGQVVRGHFAYYAVPSNTAAIAAFRYHVLTAWRRAMLRRGNRDVTTWARMLQLAADYLPAPRAFHPWPEQRFAVSHPRWEPYAGKPHVRFCAGGAQQ